MPVPPPATWPAYDEAVWERFADGLSRQVAIMLRRLDNGEGLPAKVTTGGARVTGREAAYRSLVNGLARTYGMPESYAQVAAWASVENSAATTRSLQQVIEGTPAEVQRAIAGLPTGAPPGLSLTMPNAATAVAVVQTTQQGIIAGAAGLTGEIPALIGEIVQAHVIAGASMDVTARAIQQQVGFSRARAMNIARTQTADAYNLVSQTSYAASAAVTHWEWMATEGNRTCPTCLTLDGQVFRQEVSPDVHNNCRCVMVPIDGPPTVTSNGYNANGTRIRGGREVPLDWKANQAQARAALPKSWGVADSPVDTSRLLGWKETPGWRPSAVLVKPGTPRDSIISLSAKKAGGPTLPPYG